MTKILLTGVTGFVGHHFVEEYLKNTDWDIVGIGRLDYSSKNGFDKLRDIKAFDSNRVTVFTHDLNTPFGDGLIKEIGDVDYILHVAAGSHVDNSIKDPVPFVMNNVQSTLMVLEYARKLKSLKKMLYFSTDEVYGTAPEGVNYKEGDRFNPGNPYSASKAAAECICMAYANTYKVPIVISNSMNILGERQHPEKYFPLVMNKVLDGEEVQIHANPELTQAGKRHYIHARNIANAIKFILEKTSDTLNQENAAEGRYNVVGEKEFDNLELAQLIAKFMDKPLKYKMINFHESRPGHDMRYGLDGTRLKEAGWEPPHKVEDSIKNIINWTLKEENIKWLGR
ncbi:GDP-mannose 4,6-dehydratase [uncultured Arcobacter sp.]|uniref:dTDP-glucose 4,6-dehydratase n=1 Tax=uncultured Arcobacter sp. TaxID=165434 RepID=UPI002639DBEE|nr:GDP-mannose 4,6-dehydratase [uncultured Arcobacter sp.]